MTATILREQNFALNEEVLVLKEMLKEESEKMAFLQGLIEGYASLGDPTMLEARRMMYANMEPVARPPN